MSDTPRGHLSPAEPHPAAQIALRFLRRQHPTQLAMTIEALASCAIEGNRLGEVCAETWRRLQDGEPVSDRYLMGLAWAVWDGGREEKQ